MKQEASDKFHGGQRHDFFFSAISIITPFECDLSIPDIQDTVVGNGHPVSIPSKVMDHSGRITERRFAVCNPFLFVTAVYQVEEIQRIFVLLRTAAEIEIHGFQCCQTLTAEHVGKHFDGNEELLTGRYPLTNLVQSATGNDTMNMRMKVKPLSPGMQHLNTANLRTKVFLVPGQLCQGFRCTGEKQAIQFFLIRQEQRI